jgi:hypothetical protein
MLYPKNALLATIGYKKASTEPFHYGGLRLPFLHYSLIAAKNETV